MYDIETSAPPSMQKLILKNANKNRLGAIDWGPNDFGLLDTNRCAGCIFMSPQTPQGRRGFGQ
jgi:hypothetical protein